MKKSFYRKLVFIALAAVVIFTACQQEYEDVTTSGRLKILLTDAPFPAELVAEANVTITKIEVRRVQEEDEEENPFIVVSEEEMPFNLLDLANGVTATLAETTLESGLYDQIRVYVKDPGIVLNEEIEGEQNFPLKVPSGSQSGIKVNLTPAITVGGVEEVELLLDFDVSKSFVVRGNPNSPNFKGFIFKPVIRASTPNVTGILEGNVTDTFQVAIEDTRVSIIAADTVYAETFTEANGDYGFLGVKPGTYNIEFAQMGFDTLVVENIGITIGEVTTVDTELVPVESEE